MKNLASGLTLSFILIPALSFAATTGRISDNVNGMRQLTQDNIVRQYPGAAPYYGPSNCQQQLSNFQGQMGPGYSCACPNLNANPVCTPICSVLQPQYQQQAGPQYACSCPAPNVTPVCTKLNCGQLLSQYQMQYPYPQYTCSCPAGSGAATQPTCTSNPTCAQLLPQVQAGYGANYACSCPTCSGPSDPNCYAGPSCTPIVKQCYFHLSNTTKYNTTWSCTGTQTGNNLSYSCTDGGATNSGPLTIVYTYTGTLSPGQCNYWYVPWISCKSWIGIYAGPPAGWPDPNSGTCNLSGTTSCYFNYNPGGYTGGTYMNSSADKFCPNGSGDSAWGEAINPVCWDGSNISFTAADAETFTAGCSPN